MIAIIGIGTNLGDRLANIRNAIDNLKEDSNIVSISVSRLYETKPIGYLEQPEFINGVIKVETRYSLHELFLFLKNVEKKMGRVKTVKYGPRLIDLDILFYGDAIYIDIDITVPHPQLHKRAFVLFPLSELCGDFMHPLYLKSIQSLKESLKENAGVNLLEVPNYPGIFK
jgi:2-amino-4-hydroxy-6-hydroxymethyldihydropteridine diphosphokinase